LLVWIQIGKAFQARSQSQKKDVKDGSLNHLVGGKR
jgi:hypothetical protein